MTERSEIIKKIRKIEIKSKKIVEELFSGEYHSKFKGNGIEYEESREYSFGDDVRNIDWKLSARQDKAYVKLYKEERERNIFLLIDVSNSLNFGIKRDKITEIGATLALSAVKNNDKVGAVLFSDKIEKIVPLKKGLKHSLSIIDNILTFKPESKKTDIKGTLKHFMNSQKKKCIIFLISDFLDINYEKEFKIISKKHDLIPIRIIEKSENQIPKGIFNFKDMETGETIIFDNTKKNQNLNINSKFEKKFINIYTDKDFVKPLVKYFKSH